MGEPLVSVVIPTYNRAAMLREAIASVLAQTYRHWELIVVDDGSQDDTPAVVQAFGSQLTYLRQAHAGVSAARNRGAAAARGELLAFLDSDDLWLPQKLAAQVALLQRRPQVAACYTDEIWVRCGVRVNPRQVHRKFSGWIFFQSLPRCVISPSSVLLRRCLWQQLGGFNETLPACEDYDLWLRLTLRAPVYLVPQRLIVKRGGHGDQLSRTIPVLDQYRIAALEKCLAYPLTPLQRRAVLWHLVRKCTIVAQGACKRGQQARWQRYHAKALYYRQQLGGQGVAHRGAGLWL
ncbi:MAG: glycosyl transferase [Candidatus Tectimicrobiota bacterium]|nr:MAG: glycosyl transferase [Candidatus Tectomicrobia bacterium]